MAKLNKSKRSYKKRKNIKKTRKNKGGEMLDRCSICLEHLNVNNGNGPTFTTQCNHKFHENCFSRLCEEIETPPRCPICRVLITDDCNRLQGIRDGSLRSRPIKKKVG